MPLAKPPEVEADAFRSAKWDELTAGRRFKASDAPTLSMLCQWHKVAARCVEEMDMFGGQTAYKGPSGELRAFPQIATLKMASAEIRALNKQLGIAGESEPEEIHGGGEILTIVTGRRAQRRARAANQG